MRQEFAHFVSVQASQIVALQNGLDTITVLLPEGNGGFIVGCGFENYGANVVQHKVFFDSEEQSRTDAAAAFGLDDVNRDDVSEWRVFLGQDKTGDLAAAFGDEALGAGKIEEPAQRIL